MTSSFDEELYGVYILILTINKYIHQQPHQRIIIYVYNQTVLGLIDTHQTTQTVPYNQQGYNILIDIITINQRW